HRRPHARRLLRQLHDPSLARRRSTPRPPRRHPTKPRLLHSRASRSLRHFLRHAPRLLSPHAPFQTNRLRLPLRIWLCPPLSLELEVTRLSPSPFFRQPRPLFLHASSARLRHRH